MKRLRSSGQSAVMTAMLCGMLIVAIAMATNAGKLVTEKIAMQNAVDLAVFSGAATQAGYLNEMRDINDDMWDLVYEKRKDYENSPNVFMIPGASFAPCGLAYDMTFFNQVYSCGGCAAASAMPTGLRASLAETDLQILKTRLDIKAQQLDMKNRQGRNAAEQAARRAANLNYPGTGSNSKFKVYKNGNGFGGIMKTEKAKVDVTYKGWCVEYCYPSPLPICYGAQFEYQRQSSKGYQLPGWKFRDGGEDVVFVAGIENAVPASPYLDIGGYFRSTRCGLGRSSRNGRCPLDVYAAAAPYWGKLGSIDRFDRTDKGDWDDNMTMTADKSNLLRRHQPAAGNEWNSGTYRDYRVRYIGIFESGYNMPNIPNKNRMKH